jgi:DNA-binding NtrC family response regulator
LFAEGPVLDGELVRRMIAASVFAHTDAGRLSTLPSAPPTAGGASTPPAAGSTGSSNLAEVERSHIERVLGEMGGNITRAATALGIDRRTLQRKLKGYGIDAD